MDDSDSTPVPHGPSRYQNRGCRCEPCRKAWREGAQRRRANRIAALDENGVATAATVHNAATYSNHRCRCDVCRAAWNANARSRRASRKDS